LLPTLFEEIRMSDNRKVCGIDVHKEFLQTCILSRTGETSFHRFRHTHDEILLLKELLLMEGCEEVAFESTGIYWYRLYALLETDLRVVVANAYRIKSIPGRKTDIRDAQWIAELLLNKLIKPSRILPRGDREFRDLTRNRETLVRTRTTVKNRIHKILDGAGITLKPVLKDLFGRSGRHILQGVIEGRNPETIIETIPSSVVRRRSEALREALQGSLSEIQILLLREQLDLLRTIDEKVSRVDDLILSRLDENGISDMQICLSVPGIGSIAAVTILAEIGDYRDFDRADRLASWAGLTPSVYQSADKLVTGRITKYGSTHLRWILVQSAQAASRMKDTVLSRFFRRVAFKRGRQKAIIALARKILCILWHLLQKREVYQEEQKMKKVKIRDIQKIRKLSVEEAIDFIVKEGYRVFAPGTTVSGLGPAHSGGGS